MVEGEKGIKLWATGGGRMLRDDMSWSKHKLRVAYTYVLYKDAIGHNMRPEEVAKIH